MDLDPRVLRARELVSGLARVSAEQLVELASLAFGDRATCERDGGDGLGTDAYPVVRDAWREVAARLDDGTREVQLAAAYVLAFVLEPAAETMPRLERAAEAAGDPAVKAGLLLAHGRLAASLAKWKGGAPEVPWEGIRLDDAARAETSPLVRAARVARQVWMLPRFPRKCQPEVAAALDAVAEAIEVGPWGDGDLRGLLQALRKGLWVQEETKKTERLVFQSEGVQAVLSSDDDEPEDEDEEDEEDEDEDDDIGDAEVADPYTQRKPERQPGRVALSGLRDVAWDTLEHAYGPASGVPGMLDALSSPEASDRSWAIEALSASIHHQGSVYSASTAAVPFLVQLAGDERVEDRHLILRLLCGIAVHQPDGCLVAGARRWRSEAYDAVVAGGPTYTRLLFDGDASVRTGAAYVLAYVDPPPAGALDGLRSALAREPDRRARACELLAIGYVSRYLESVEDRARLVAHLDDDAPAVRACAAIALLQLAAADAPVEARAVLAKAPDEVAPVRGFFPWAEGDVGSFARTIRMAFQTDDELWTLIDAALAGTTSEDAARAAPRLFGKLFHDKLHDRDRPWLPEELDPPRRKLLRYFLATTPRQQGSSVTLLPFWEGANESGLFSDADTIARLLGDAPGPLDRAVTIADEARPLWAWIIAVDAGAVDARALLDVARTWPADDRIAIADDVLAWSYRLTSPRWHTEYGAEPDHPHGPDASNDYTSRALVLLADLLGDDPAVRAWARRIADAEVASGAKRDAKKGMVAAIVLARAGELEPALDALLAFDQAPATTYRDAIRVVMRGLPADRAERLVLTQPLYQYQAYVDPRGEVRRWTNAGGWDLLDLAPAPVIARLVLAALREWERHRGAGDDRGALPLLGTTTSSIDSKPGPDEEFPRARAIALLARAGDAAVTAIDAATGLADRALLDEARAAALAAAN